jgi:hypothetical protein
MEERMAKLSTYSEHVFAWRLAAYHANPTHDAYWALVEWARRYGVLPL